jgi:hypothetical protein
MENELKHAVEELHRAEDELRKAQAEEADAIRHIEKATEEIIEAERPRLIHFKVEGESYETDRHELTPDQILREYGQRDPATNYLSEIKPAGEKESFQGKGAVPIKMHDGMRFLIFSVGPMTVS